MKQTKLISNESQMEKSCFIASSFFERLLGLMFRKNWPLQTALVFPHCNSIHTCFMRFKIDVVFVDKNGVILKTFENLSTWRFLIPIRNAAHAIEMNALEIKTHHLRPGMKLTCEGVFG